MLAELYNKVSSSNSNLTERREDELTGNFFGTMRYIPFDKGLKKIFVEGIRPKELSRYIEELSLIDWSEKIKFWEQDKLEDRRTELDIKIEFDNLLVGIEVKYLSGLSSEDDICNTDIEDTKSYNQLAREARVINQIGGEKHKLLILLADELSCHDIFENVKSRNIIDGVELGYISWQSVLSSLKKLNDLNTFEQVMINDLICLLNKKGFEKFEKFESCRIVEKEIYWSFKWKFSIKFDFQNKQYIEKGTHYEFRRKCI